VKSIKTKYISLSANCDDIPIFMQPWWLDAVVENDDWEAILIEEESAISAAFVYVVKTKGPFKALGMPGLTPFLGLWFAKDTDQDKAAAQLMAMLPKHDKFYMQMNYEVFGTEFDETGFKKAVLHTYVLSGIKDHERTYANFKQRVKGEIKKAEGNIHVTESSDIDGLYALCQMSYERQGKKMDFSLELVRNIYHAATKNNNGILLTAQDSEGNLHAGTLIVWDQNQAYYLLNGGNPALRSSGANSLLIWEAIKRVSKFANKFDFEGSMIPGVEKYIQGYNPEKKQYALYTRTNSMLVAAAENIKGTLKRKS